LLGPAASPGVGDRGLGHRPAERGHGLGRPSGKSWSGWRRRPRPRAQAGPGHNGPASWGPAASRGGPDYLDVCHALRRPDRQRILPALAVTASRSATSARRLPADNRPS
jgi:hypothetical protein